MRISGFRRALAMLSLTALAPISQAEEAKKLVYPKAPSEIVTEAPASSWHDLDPQDVVVWTLKDGHRAVMWLATPFAPVHIQNIRTLVRAHYFDTAAISRLQDNYVVQWGREEGAKLPDAITAHPPAEYENAGTRLKFTELPYYDSYALKVGFDGAWPVGREGGQEWLTHCYGMVGAGRDMAPDTGSGAELYAVSGHAPRHLDRNITVGGRFIEGMEFLDSYPRGTEALGFYKTEGERIPFASAMMAADMPEADRPHYQVMDTGSKSFAEWIKARANRGGPFFIKPAGAVDLCNALPPVRIKP